MLRLLGCTSLRALGLWCTSDGLHCECLGAAVQTQLCWPTLSRCEIYGRAIYCPPVLDRKGLQLHPAAPRRPLPAELAQRLPRLARLRPLALVTLLRSSGSLTVPQRTNLLLRPEPLLGGRLQLGLLQRHLELQRRLGLRGQVELLAGRLGLQAGQRRLLPAGQQQLQRGV